MSWWLFTRHCLRVLKRQPKAITSSCHVQRALSCSFGQSPLQICSCLLTASRLAVIFRVEKRLPECAGRYQGYVGTVAGQGKLVIVSFVKSIFSEFKSSYFIGFNQTQTWASNHLGNWNHLCDPRCYPDMLQYFMFSNWAFNSDVSLGNHVPVNWWAVHAIAECAQKATVDHKHSCDLQPTSSFFQNKQHNYDFISNIV